MSKFMFVIVLFLLNNCSSSENLTENINSQLKFKSNSKEFVIRSGTELTLNGTPYKFSGANQYYLFYKSQKMVDDVIEKAAAMGLNSIRTWGFCDGCTDKGGFVFQKEAGVYDENTFKKMDYIIAKASKHSIRLVIPFVNNWDDMGGMSQYTKWSMGYQDHDKFYTDPRSKEIYKNYVSYFLNRVNTITGIKYKEDPTILMWELTNEMRNRSDRSGSVVTAWVKEMADFVKSVDSNHLLSTGMEGFMAENLNGDYAHNGFEGTDFVAAHSIDSIDVASIHLYPDHWGFSESQSLDWIQEHIRKSKKIIGKPVYLGEFGLRDKSRRDVVYANWYELGKKENMDGIMFWILSGRQDDGSLYPDYDGFTVYYPEDTNTVKVLMDKTKEFLNKITDLLVLVDIDPPIQEYRQPI